MSDVGVLLPVRIETRFKGGDLWVRVVPDEPWFLRDDPRVSADELLALRRYAAAPPDPGADGVPPAWRVLANQVGPARAADLHRRFITAAPGGVLAVRTPNPDEMRDGPVLPRIVGFPTELVVWLGDGSGGLTEVLRLAVKRTRLLADFADPDLSGDRRWWEDWDEAVTAGLAGVVPAVSLAGPVDALYVTGLGDGDPAELFAALAAEGRLGLLPPGTPTNSVAGAPAAPLAADARTWWELLQSPPGDTDLDVSRALTGNTTLLGSLPGGERQHRGPTSALVTVLWPALWGFALGHVFDIARGPVPARWAGRALFPEGAYPALRVGPQPYGLLPATSWSAWEIAEGDPALEAPLVTALLRLRDGHARSARARGTAAGQTTDGLLDLIADTPTSGRFRYRLAWPLELWWLAMVGSGVPQQWRPLAEAWSTRYPLTDELGISPLRRYGARGASRLVGVPLVLPPGVDPAALPDLLLALAAAAMDNPAGFADTARLESTVLDGPGDSLLLRLVIRSLQLLIADLRRERDEITTFDPEPFSRNDDQAGRLEELVAAAQPVDAAPTSAATALLTDVVDAVRALSNVPVPELERMLAAAVDCSSHRIDPWLVAVPQRRLDDLLDSGVASHRLGAYGWVDGPAPGNPGPTAAGLLHTPSASAALAAAVLRDRAISDGDGRWDLDVTSRSARVADRLAEHVRAGAHLAEALGREVERVVGRTVDIARLRSDFPVRTEHAGRRVCDGLRVLAEQQFPVPLDAGQEAAVAELREGLDTYGDLLVADAVHHLVEGRPEIAGAVMEAAAGLARPPELSLLRTPREGRAVSTSVVLALAHAPAPPLPATDDARALLSPAGTLDHSMAAYLADAAGNAAAWDFQVRLTDGTGSAASRTVLLADLDLQPADALALTRSGLERLAVDRAAVDAGIGLGDGDPGPGGIGEVVGGSAGDRYELAANLVGLVGRSPAGPRALAEAAADPAAALDAAVDASLLVRYAAVLDVCAALVRALGVQLTLVTPDGQLGGADPVVLRRLIAACAGWGVAPNPPPRAADPAGAPVGSDQRRLERLVDSAVLALAQLQERLAAAPDETAAAALPAAQFLAAAAALVSPTGQVGVTGTARADSLPPMQRADGLDAQWLTITAAVRPALARLEAHQLAADPTLRPWANRAADPWQTNPSDARRLVAIYAMPQLELATAPSDALLAVAALDRFSEVIPAAEQLTGAAFGFDAPAARAQQAILLAVPPDPATALDQPMLARILVETRELAHARMARPVDLDGEFWGLAPTGLLPASGAVATPLEVHG